MLICAASSDLGEGAGARLHRVSEPGKPRCEAMADLRPLRRVCGMHRVVG